MKPSIALELHREAIRLIVERHKCCNPRIFGSVIRGEDTEESDLDLLVDLLPDTTLFNIGGLQNDLIELLGVRVQVVTPGALPKRFRHEVLAVAVPV